MDWADEFVAQLIAEGNTILDRELLSTRLRAMRIDTETHAYKDGLEQMRKALKDSGLQLGGGDK